MSLVELHLVAERFGNDGEKQASCRDSGPPPRRVLFESHAVQIGLVPVGETLLGRQLECGRGDPYLMLADTSLVVALGAESELVADRNDLVFVNPGEPVTVVENLEYGGSVLWMSLRPEIFTELVDSPERELAVDPKRPFFFRRTACSDLEFLVTRVVLGELAEGRAPFDALRLERLVLTLAERAVARALASPRSAVFGRRRSGGQRRVALGARRLLAVQPEGSPGLRAMARHLGCSPSHLSRCFSAETGLSLSLARRRLRLRKALTGVLETTEELRTLSSRHGYSSPSHFAYDFRRTFGWSPSEVRRHRARLFRRLVPSSGSSSGPARALGG